MVVQVRADVCLFDVGVYLHSLSGIEKTVCSYLVVFLLYINTHRRGSFSLTFVFSSSL